MAHHNLHSQKQTLTVSFIMYTKKKTKQKQIINDTFFRHIISNTDGNAIDFSNVICGTDREVTG